MFIATYYDSVAGIALSAKALYVQGVSKRRNHGDKTKMYVILSVSMAVFVGCKKRRIFIFPQIGVRKS